MTENFDPVAHNRAAWDREVDSGNEWTRPVGSDVIARARAGDWSVVLIGYQPVPRDWFPAELAGAAVLCLASGGGQQGPVLAAAGADVTVFDNSPRQLGRDEEVAAREGLAIRTVLGDMRDLGAFPDASFDVVFNPVSNVFCPELAPVWRESFRVLRPGGVLLAGFMNPDIYLFDEAALERDELVVRHPLPFSSLDLPEAERQQYYGDGPVEFSHSLTEQIGGQLAAGFTLTHLVEAPHHTDPPRGTCPATSPPAPSSPAEPGCADAGGAYQVPGSGPPYQDWMIWCAIDTGGGSSSSPAATSAASSARVRKRASAISSSSTVICCPGPASARNPSIRLCGIGQAWLPTYRMPLTAIPVSSQTSRATVCSADSPASTKPARMDTRPGGHMRLRASRQRSSSSVTSMITAGSMRGKCSLPSTGHRRMCPAGAGTVRAPQRGQWVWRACQLASATAWVNSPASRSPSSVAACRRLAGRTPGSGAAMSVPGGGRAPAPSPPGGPATPK